MISILYVEDEPFLAKIVKETLESRNYSVTLVEDGGLAVEQFRSGKYNICILDIMLPNINGYDIAKEIRIISTQVPLLFLSAKDQTADLLKGFESGGNDYMRKPFSMEELMARIENLIALTNAKSTTALNTGGKFEIGSQFVFDLPKLELSNGSDALSISHRESQILELLCQNMNQVTERKDILIKVWNDDSFYNSRNLDVYITKLRGYFKSDPTIQIKTLKGVGYQFICEG